VVGCDDVTTAAGTTTCTLTINADATVTATFAARPPQSVTLTVTTAGSGIVGVTSPGAPQNCAPTCTVAVAPGTVVQLAADPAAGNFLSAWSGTDCATDSQTCPVRVVQDMTVQVAFSQLLTLTVSRTGDGTGTLSGTGLNCAGTTCTGQYRSGATVALHAAPTGGSMFGGWTGCTASGLDCTVSMTADRTVTAAFAAPRDGTPPVVTMSALGKTVGIGTGGQAATADSPTQVTVIATGSDPDGPVTRTDIWGEITGTCFSGAGGIERTINQPFARLSSANGGSSAYDLTSVAGDLCQNPALVTLVFRLKAQAVSEGGTSAFTDELTITWNPGLIR
jgi:hypothetical protein